MCNNPTSRSVLDVDAAVVTALPCMPQLLCRISDKVLQGTGDALN